MPQRVRGDVRASSTGWCPDLRDVVVSVHCHDDLGLAVANSLAGVRSGLPPGRVRDQRHRRARRQRLARGDRDAAAHARAERSACGPAIDTTEIARTSRLVSRLTGYPVQPNKAIVGRNAFAHEAGIHQDGVLKERTTYEIMDATTVGLRSNSIVLGKHSGRHALRKALEEMGFELDGQALNTAFKRFKEIADRKKQVTAMDLEALVTDELREDIAGYALEWFEVEASSRRPPHAKVSVTLPDGGSATGSVHRRRPDRRVFQAINAATGDRAEAQRVHDRRRHRGPGRARRGLGRARGRRRRPAPGQGVSTDIIDAAARAYVRALSVARARAQAPEALGLPEPTP